MKVVPEGYNGAGMNYDGGNRRDVNGKANAGLTLGIIGTALGAWALFGNRRSSVLGGAGGRGILDEFREFLDARGGRGGRGSRSGRGGMRNRIGYDTYDTYGCPSHKDDKEEKILTMYSPFFIYLNLSMDKFIDVIVDGILSNFDFGFMFIVNVLTYIIIKVIDYFNGDNKVPTWQKRCVLVISIAAMIGIYITAGYDNTIMLVNSAILAPVFWSWVVSPILKKLGVGYKDIDNAIG